MIDMRGWWWKKEKEGWYGYENSGEAPIGSYWRVLPPVWQEEYSDLLCDFLWRHQS